jgi:hypothetical protein
LENDLVHLCRYLHAGKVINWPQRADDVAKPSKLVGADEMDALVMELWLGDLTCLAGGEIGEELVLSFKFKPSKLSTVMGSVSQSSGRRALRNGSKISSMPWPAEWNI